MPSGLLQDCRAAPRPRRIVPQIERRIAAMPAAVYAAWRDVQLVTLVLAAFSRAADPLEFRHVMTFREVDNDTDTTLGTWVKMSVRAGLVTRNPGSSPFVLQVRRGRLQVESVVVQAMTRAAQVPAIRSRPGLRDLRSRRVAGTIHPLARAFVTAASAATLIGGCASQAPSPTQSAARPGIEIDSTFQRSNGEWTFTGHVDPQGAATDVVLEIGPGPSNARVFTRQLPVAHVPLDPAPLTITTGEIPDLPEICVRFTATNSAGSSSSTPLCFPFDLPTAQPDIVTPTTTFSAPAFGTTIILNRASFTVSWTESNGGSGLDRRSLQRRVAAYAAGACEAYADDGAPSTDSSPVESANLLDGHCYEWVLSLGTAGSTTMTTSGVVRVVLGGSG